MVKRKSSTISNFKSLILQNIATYFKEYVYVTVCLVLGVIAGVIFVNNLSDNQSSEITTYISSFLETLKNDIELNYVELLKNSLMQNLFLVLALWFVGATLIGIPLVFGIILFRGFCLGYTVSAVIQMLGVSRGLVFVLTAMFLQNLIFIPAIIALAVSGICLYKSVVKKKNAENIKLAILKHSAFALAVLMVLMLSSLVEVFVSTNLLKICVNFF